MGTPASAEAGTDRTAARVDRTDAASASRTAIAARRTRPLRNRLRRLAYGAYYLLPPKTRRRIVRLAMGRYTVGAVALVRDSEQPGRLLLLRQPRTVGWVLPAGLLRRGESPVDGCVRELEEETGLRLRPEDLTPAVPAAVVHHRGGWVDVVFEATVPGSSTQFSVDGAEIIEVAWHREDNLPPLLIGTARLLAHYGLGPYAGYPEARA